MFCSSCGQELQPGTKFCTRCGKPIDPTLATPAQQTPPPQPEAPDPSFSANTNTFHASDYGEKIYASKKGKSAPDPQTAQAPTDAPESSAHAEEYPRVDFTHADFNPPAPRRSRGSSSSGKLLLIAGLAATAIVLVVIIALLTLAGIDRANIQTIKNGYLGVFTDRTVQEIFYDACGAEYDTATWEGTFGGLARRDVVLTFTNSENPDAAPFTVRFAMGKDETFRISDMDTSGVATDDEEALARILNLHYFDLSSYEQSLLSSAPYTAVLYGAGPDYEGDRAFICRVFDEEPADFNILHLMGDVTDPDSATDDGNASADQKNDPENTPEAPVIHIADARYYDVNTDYRYIDVSHTINEEGVPVYSYVLTVLQDNVTTISYSGSGTWAQVEEGVFFTGTHKEIIQANGQPHERVLREAFPGKLWLEEELVVWGDEETGMAIHFSSAEKQIVIPGIDAIVSSSAPSLSGGKLRVTSAAATSTISQETVSNDPIVMFDGIDETSWQEGVEGYGIGEEISFTLDGLQKIEALSFKLGNWRNDRYFNGNAAPKTLTLIIDNYQTQVTFDHARTTQWVTFSAPLYADSIRIVIDDIHQGTDYEDTCINEITVYGERYE